MSPVRVCKVVSLTIYKKVFLQSLKSKTKYLHGLVLKTAFSDCTNLGRATGIDKFLFPIVLTHLASQLLSVD